MRNDSADGRTVEAHSEAFSGGAYSRWAARTQADPDPSCAGSGTVDSQHRCAMAHAAAKLSELQNCASTLSNLVLPRDFASGFDGRCQRSWKCWLTSKKSLAWLRPHGRLMPKACPRSDDLVRRCRRRQCAFRD